MATITIRVEDASNCASAWQPSEAALFLGTEQAT